MVKQLVKREVRSLSYSQRPLPPLADFYLAIDAERVKIIGYTPAYVVGCVGMAWYLLWEGISGQVYASYVTDSFIRSL